MAKILLITTGGTISCPDKNEARAPEDLSDAFLKALAPIKSELDIISPFCLDSSYMTPRHFSELAKIIRENYDGYNGFIITHGTDTLAYAAAALSCLIVNSDKPIVLTGSMKPFSATNSDAPVNLRNAFLLASDVRAFGVSVVFGKYAFDGRHVSKLSTSGENAFENVDYPKIAGFERQRVALAAPFQRSKKAVSFRGEPDERVEIVYPVPGVAPPTIADETRAVIILGFGTGGVPESYEEFIAKLVSRGVYVIMSTQVLYGGTKLSLYEVGSRIKEKYPVIETGKMTVEYASMKAMVSLSLSDNFEDFRNIFLNDD